MGWPFGLGLYRYAMLNAMFVRVDAADAAGLADAEAHGDEMGNVAGARRPWIPADEFECYRRSCGGHPWGNPMAITSLGIYSHLLPHVFDQMQNQSSSRHPVSVQVAVPPPSFELPWPRDAPQQRPREALT